MKKKISKIICFSIFLQSPLSPAEEGVDLNQNAYSGEIIFALGREQGEGTGKGYIRNYSQQTALIALKGSDGITSLFAKRGGEFVPLNPINAGIIPKQWFEVHPEKLGPDLEREAPLRFIFRVGEVERNKILGGSIEVFVRATIIEGVYSTDNKLTKREIFVPVKLRIE